VVSGELRGGEMGGRGGLRRTDILRYGLPCDNKVCLGGFRLRAIWGGTFDSFSSYIQHVL